MKILILGIDGYIGWPLSLQLLNEEHEVFGVDCGVRRSRVGGAGSDSLTPIKSTHWRMHYLKENYPNFIDYAEIFLGRANSTYINSVIEYFRPDTIVHLAEQPSAPWSMVSAEQAMYTQNDNVIGTLHILWAMREHCPNAHLVKLGTMGEYGTPNCIIPEGTIPGKCIEPGELALCPMAGLLFPRTAGSYYHLSKVHDTHNIHFACRTWGLRSTDIMQGVVHGLVSEVDNELITRFDYDQYFGTVINRFCVQALIGMPLTIYGQGGQTRGFIPLRESIDCISLAIQNPPRAGNYRTFNQFQSIHTINDIALAMHSITGCEVSHIDNPRTESEDHMYRPEYYNLFELGYDPECTTSNDIRETLEIIKPYVNKINKAVIMPTTKWR